MKTILIQVFQILVLCSCMVIASCASAPKVSKEDSYSAKILVPQEGKALVYIIRSTTTGFAVAMNVTCNNKIVGATKGRQFIHFNLTPGNYVLASHAENKHELPLIIEAGKTYFIEQKVKMGWVRARTELIKVSEQVGRNKMKNCSLSSQIYNYGNS